ncbi:hypothetical protein Ato02nite_044090 [Paractinoplanes toevensis]|uniref:Uncharacterized protein n=1 Tax=Paractinoplanes toevensis TaxID=571911 RepID=A0A919W890_9ACTN|nr:hypothetical protein Ato02nite_044090 [Actinoplanes toevensis]
MSVYFDHPQHAQLAHSLNVDLLNPAIGPGARVAVELDVPTARALARAILAILDSAPPELLADALVTVPAGAL